MSDLLSFSHAAYDAQALNGLKRDVAQDPQGNLRQVAQQMEGLFVQMMLKSMRSALPQDGVLNSEQTQLYTSLYDQQIAQQIAGRGIGIADMLVQQLSAETQEPDEQAGRVPMMLDGDILQTLPRLALTQIMRKALPSLPPVEKMALPAGNGHFVSQLMIPAQIASQQSGIHHYLILAQAALESGWGRREIPTAEGKPSHNLFGVKAGRNWDGPTTDIVTTEFEQGVAKKITASFRVYSSYTEAISDYIRLLTRNPRYAEVAAASSPEQAAHALQKAGYATDPNYAQKLVSVIQQIKGAGQQAVKAYTHDLSQLF